MLVHVLTPLHHYMLNPSPSTVLMMPMNVTATATSPTTINVQWVQPPFVNTIDDYFISWEPFGLPDGVVLQGGMEKIQCTVTAGKRSVSICTNLMEFNITGLEEFINYRVMVIASNDVGNSTSGTATALTLPASEWYSILTVYTPIQNLFVGLLY